VSCPRLADLGGYVLGALEPAERASVDAHLSGCPECREELSRLAPLPGLLGRLQLSDVLEPAEPDPSRFSALLAEVRRDRHRRRGRWIAAAAAAVVVALVAGGAGGLAWSTRGNPAKPPAAATSEQQVRATDAATGTSLRATLTSRPWGTDIALRLSGVPVGETCRLVVTAVDGRQETAATWYVGYVEELRLPAATAIPAGQIRQLSVVTTAGRQLVVAPVST
jgi:hypothetical protein